MTIFLKAKKLTYNKSRILMISMLKNSQMLFTLENVSNKTKKVNSEDKEGEL